MFVHWKQGLFLSMCEDDIKKSWQEEEYGSTVEELDEKCGY